MKDIRELIKEELQEIEDKVTAKVLRRIAEVLTDHANDLAPADEKPPQVPPDH